MTKIPITPEYLDEMQRTLDAYSTLLAEWREVVSAAVKAGVEANLTWDVKRKKFAAATFRQVR